MTIRASRITRFVCSGVLALGVATLAAPAQAQDDKKEPVFELAVLGGLPVMFGKTDTDAGKSTLPIDISDATEEWNFAALAIANLQLGDLSVRGSGEFMDLTSDREQAFVRVGPHGNPKTQAETRPKAELWLADLTLGYRLFHAEDTVLEPSFELYGGGRYYDYSPDIGMQQAGVTVAKINESDAWVDAIVGARINLALSKTVDMQIEGDVGGFSWGNSSDFSWMQMTSLGWSFTDYTRFYMAYKFEQFRKSDGDTKFNLQFRGPYAGLSVMF